MRKTLSTAVAVVVLALAAPAPAADSSPLTDGKAFYEKECAVCHTLERSLAVQADRASWEGTIAKMVAKGAKLEKTQIEPILGYLTAKSAFETKCNTCHDLQRPLKAIKDPEQWKATVLRMAAMKPGQISDADAGAITLYLSLVTPAKAAAPPAPAAPGYK